MPAIELEEVTMVEITDESLETAVVAVGGVFSFQQACATIHC
jgi:hypothetical protein